MKNSVIAGLAVCAVMASVSALWADAPAKETKPGIQRVTMLKVTLPRGLCEFDGALPSNLVEKIRVRRDFDRLLTYMLKNCPELGLPLADFATASISETGEDGDDGTAGTGGPIIPGGDTGDDGTNGDAGDGGSGDGGSTGDDDDGNNGHGNDESGRDPSNPGNKP